MSPPVSSFLLSALHVFQIRTLGSLGFATRVALSNKSHNTGRYATDYRVDLTVYSPDGQSRFQKEGVAELAVDSIVRIDCSEWQAGAVDQVMIFHLMPMRLLPEQRDDGTVDIGREEIWSLFTAQDHHVEYYRGDGFSAGVLYQSGAFNYQKFSREETTVIQAPKVYLSEAVDTLLSVINTSFEADYRRVARLQCCLVEANGAVVTRWTEAIAPFTCRTISMKEIVTRLAARRYGPETQFFTLLALCENAALLPLILNRDSLHGDLAVEHSLPPLYYGKTVTGPVRAEMIRDLRASGLFEATND